MTRYGMDFSAINLKNSLAILFLMGYTTECCDMIAVKREVVMLSQECMGFPWSECQVEPDDKSLYTVQFVCRIKSRNTCVKIPREELKKCDSAFSFFRTKGRTRTGACTVTGKSYCNLFLSTQGGNFNGNNTGNENYTESV